ncbi:hypothetical protein PSTT_08043 [Puccinia striiformis]|uniref:Uncharacterized protein n=1 Tax=Puccinia striiformis TaxID=27350 RepID=A0A2S4VE31_9BASI|nr:hypothetical protein PSTT_08043 [Puccinia striiformis]
MNPLLLTLVVGQPDLMLGKKFVNGAEFSSFNKPFTASLVLAGGQRSRAYVVDNPHAENSRFSLNRPSHPYVVLAAGFSARECAKVLALPIFKFLAGRVHLRAPVADHNPYAETSRFSLNRPSLAGKARLQDDHELAFHSSVPFPRNSHQRTKLFEASQGHYLRRFVNSSSQTLPSQTVRGLLRLTASSGILSITRPVSVRSSNDRPLKKGNPNDEGSRTKKISELDPLERSPFKDEADQISPLSLKTSSFQKLWTRGWLSRVCTNLFLLVASYTPPSSASAHHFSFVQLDADFDALYHSSFCRTPPTNSFDSRCSSLTLSPNQSSNSHRSSLTLSPNQSCNFHRSSLTLSPNLSHQPILQFSSVQLDAVAQPISSVALT